MENASLIHMLKAIVECDQLRITRPYSNGLRFVIIGFCRDTRDDLESVHIRNGKPFNFKYLEEQVIASGSTEEELIKATKDYAKLLKMNAKEYLEKICAA